MKKNKYLNNLISYSTFLIPHSLLLLLIVSFLLSCQTMPKTQDTFLEDIQFLPLESGASAYVFANVQKAQLILNLLPFEELNDPQARQMMDRTGYFVAAIFPKASGKRFQLAAWGNYPSARAGFAFTFDKNWKKQSSASGGSYWYSSAGRLSLSMTAKQAFIASSLTSQPFDPFNQDDVNIPEGFNVFRSGADLSCWIEDAAVSVTRVLNNAGLPVQVPIKQMFINLDTVSGGRYEAAIRLKFDSATQARGMASIINLASSFGFTGSDFIASLFMANPSAQNGNSLDFISALLDDQDIMSLFDMFLSM